MVLALLLILAFLLTFQKAKPLAALLFLIWFEPGQICIWSTALFKAICRFSDHERILMLCLAASHLCLWLAHLSLVYLDKVAKADSYHFPPYLIQCVGIIGMTVTLHHMVDSGMFNEAGEDEEYNAISSDGEDAEAEEFDIGRWAISPERCWTLAYWFIMSTYSFGAFLLFNVSKPDLRLDPILRTYKAFHPCVIIDYMPGNLWAQLTFLLYVYSLLMSATASLIRAARCHNGVLMVVSSQAYGVAWLGLPILVLACTFNPTYTSVLSHSIPYMVCVGSIGFVILSELVVLYVTSETTTRRHIACYVYNGVMLLATGYAILFMSKLLGSTKLIDVTLPVTDPRNRLQPEDVHISPLTTALAFSILPLHWLRPWFSPLTQKPVTANIEVRKGNWENLHHKAIAMPNHQNRWHIVLKASTLGFWGRFVTMAGFGLAYFFNLVFAEESQTIRGKFTNVPGAAIIALSWSVGVPLMALQAFVLATYVRLRFKRGEFAFFFVAAAAFASVTSVLAHGGTIPHAPDWYIGPELYAVGLLLWGTAECVLLVKESEMTPLVIFKLIIGAVTGLGMIINVFAFGTVPFVGFLCSWIVYSFCDPLHVSMIITNIEIGSVENSPETLCNNFFQWAWYDDHVD